MGFRPPTKREHFIVKGACSWDDTHLAQLYYPNNPDEVRAATPWLTLEQTYGCCACSWAMVLKNLGEATVGQRTDFRSDVTDYLAPDPFTVSLASTLDYQVFRIEPDVTYFRSDPCGVLT